VSTRPQGRLTVVVLLGLALWPPISALGEEGVPPEIRVLFLAPRASSNRSPEPLEAFARAVIASPGAITPVHELDQAEVVVQFTDYSRKLTKDGKPQQRWSGNFKVVGPRPQDRSTQPPTPEHFSIVVTGPEEWGQRAAVAKFGELLAKALGRQQAAATPEPI
jgi:hypothetical protein